MAPTNFVIVAAFVAADLCKVAAASGAVGHSHGSATPAGDLKAAPKLQPGARRTA